MLKLLNVQSKLVAEFKSYLAHLDRETLVARLSNLKYPLAFQDELRLSLYADTLIDHDLDSTKTVIELGKTCKPWLFVARSLLRSYQSKNNYEQWKIIDSIRDEGIPEKMLEIIVTYTLDQEQLEIVYNRLNHETRMLLMNRHKDSVEQTAFILQFLHKHHANLSEVVYSVEGEYSNAILTLASLSLPEFVRETLKRALHQTWL